MFVLVNVSSHAKKFMEKLVTGAEFLKTIANKDPQFFKIYKSELNAGLGLFCNRALNKGDPVSSMTSARWPPTSSSEMATRATCRCGCDFTQKETGVNLTVKRRGNGEFSIAHNEGYPGWSGRRAR